DLVVETDKNPPVVVLSFYFYFLQSSMTGCKYYGTSYGVVIFLSTIFPIHVFIKKHIVFLYD
ncbi:TPA: hypothetical protein ACHAT1_002848, partial [Enterococcus faecium]|nr:hypothetical protein [Enterococcus faecium]